jgi:hypothetical protein
VDRCESARYLQASRGSGHLPQALGALDSNLRITWSAGTEVHEVEVSSFDEIVARFTSLESSIDEPTVVEVWDPESGASCSVLAGSAAGSVFTYQATLDPPYFISLGTAADTDCLITARHNGELIEYLERQLVPNAAVLPFLHTFWALRQRSEVVHWEEV